VTADQAIQAQDFSKSSKIMQGVSKEV